MSAPADDHGWGEPHRQGPGRAHPSTYLVREISSIGRQLDRAIGDHLTVNETDMRAMSLLLARSAMTASELAQALNLSKPATSMAVDRLERLGHVTRERDPADRRRVHIRATPGSSSRAHDALMPMIREVDHLLDDLPESDRRTVQRYLQGVTEAMRRRLEAIRSENESQR